MSRYTLIFFLVVLTGCSTADQSAQLSHSTIEPSACTGQHICANLLEIQPDAGDFKISVHGVYHPIKAASIWIDGKTYPLRSLQVKTDYRKSSTGQRISVRRFSSDLALNEALQHSMRVRLSADLQSYSLTRTLKRPGYSDPTWSTILADLNSADE